MYCYEGNVRYKKVWYGVKAEFDVEPGERGNFSGRPDSWYPGTPPSAEFDEVLIEDENGIQVDLGYRFEMMLAEEVVKLVGDEGKCADVPIYLN